MHGSGDQLFIEYLKYVIKVGRQPTIFLFLQLQLIQRLRILTVYLQQKPSTTDHSNPNPTF